MPPIVRPYAPDDRNAVRRICCDTGFMGKPVDPLFSDREAFADFFTAYYTDCEPENCWVGVTDGDIVGYLLACLDPPRYRKLHGRIVARTVPRVLGRLVAGRYPPQNARFLWWFVTRSLRETPRTPPDTPHFHFNVLEQNRGDGVGRRMLLTFLRRLRDRGVPRIYGQMQTYANRRAPRVFERFGFRMVDKRRVTKFERFGYKDVYVATFVNELGSSEPAPGRVVP